MEREVEQVTQLDLGKRIVGFLGRMKHYSICKGCDAKIYWFIHEDGTEKGKPVPYSNDLQIHFVACPGRDKFRKK